MLPPLLLINTQNRYNRIFLFNILYIYMCVKWEWTLMTYSIGDIVTRRSYNSDQYFKIEKIKGDFAILRSVKTRLMADAPINDLIKITNISLRQLHKELLLESIDYLKRHQRDII